ncbi:MAG: ECF transporter S component [Clostridia bacterium]|nr:ECF transporter S component [Clostridia bacterium]
MKSLSLQSVSLSKKLAFTALFAALCCVSTILIVIPLPNGYFNAGDIFVLLAGWCLGPLYGTAAAAVGSALADIWSGFALYAPATFCIKGLVALLAWLVWSGAKRLIKNPALDVVCRAVAAVLAEAVMVAGYFLFESVLYGFAGGAAALVGNTLQGVCCAVGGVAVVCAISPIKAVRRLFPALGTKNE